MSDEALHELALTCGIAVDWIDALDRPQRVSDASLRRILGALGLPCATPSQCRESCQRMREAYASSPLVTTTVGMPTTLAGWAGAVDAKVELVLEDGTRRSIEIADGRLPPIDVAGYHRIELDDRELGLAVAPRRCLTVGDVTGGRKAWGIAVQLYSLRRRGDGGIGDSGALRSLIAAAATEGADAVALSPTHSLFPGDPGRFSPYGPSSRLFLNPLLADAGDPSVVPDSTGLIDWPAASLAKYALLQQRFDRIARDGDAEFDRFVREGGADLERHARFEAERSKAPIAYHLFLQWMADRAFAAAQDDARRAGMRIGLISDLAVGVDSSGSQVATQPDAFLRGVTIGAPPDVFNAHGQGWGLTSFSPWGLAAQGFAPFIATVRAAMRHAGGVRIDHAMSLMRLWVIPDGAAPSDGAYLAYPLDDLLRLLALESHRHRAVVIGEDLGTVPPEFRVRCRDAGIAGMDVLWFTRDGKRFLPPEEWRPDSVSMTSTHDLPTVAGWWSGADIELRSGLGLAAADEKKTRTADRRSLWKAFVEAGIATGKAPPARQPGPAVDAACAFVAQAVDELALLPLEDLLGLVDQPNLPGTIDQHPNWRRRLSEQAEELLKSEAVQRRLRLIRERRA